MITVVSTSSCVWCKRVKELLAQHGIQFEEWVPPRAELINLLEINKVNTVPQVFLGDPRSTDEGVIRIGGYDDTKKWIDSRGCE